MEEGVKTTESGGTGRRKRLRLCYLAAVRIVTAEGKIVRGNIRDIGIESVFVKLDETEMVTFTQNESIDVEMIVNKGASRLTISSPGRILREDRDGVAVMFNEPLKWWPIFSLFPVNEHFLYDVVTKA